MTITSKNVHLSLAIDLGRKTLRVRRGSFPNSRKYEVKRYKNDWYYKENEDDRLKSQPNQMEQSVFKVLQKEKCNDSDNEYSANFRILVSEPKLIYISWTFERDK